MESVVIIFIIFSGNCLCSNLYPSLACSSLISLSMFRIFRVAGFFVISFKHFVCIRWILFTMSLLASPPQTPNP